MPAIFITHSNRDQRIADDIKTALRHLGFEQVFLDFDKDSGTGAGSDWERVLYDKVARCHALILVLTPNWLASTWCRIELAQARALGKVILPVICEPLGERYVLPEIQAVDLIDWKAGGLDRIEKRLRAITSELARGFVLDPNRLPYPGIHAFEAEDAAIYFGRDDEVRSVIERLDARRARGGARLLVIIGASGSGKSSLLKAGVLPQLARRQRDWIVLPPVRPEKAPMEALSKAIAQRLGKPDEWREWKDRLNAPAAVEQFAELLKDLRIGEQRTATILLPIDQFEEVFTVAAPEERSAFLRLLAGLLAPARDLPIMLLATGRSDVLDGLIEAGELAHLYDTEPLPPIPLDRVARLVEGPAAVASLNVDDGLAERMASDLESPEALPLLAHALWLLHQRGASAKRLSLVDYLSLGDAERGLNPIQNSIRLAADQALDQVLPKASERELLALRDAFVPHLVRVRLDDGKRVRQPAPMRDLPEDARRLVRALVAARLLVTRAGFVEVAHEALFKAWPTLDRWLSEEHVFLSDLERIRDAHAEWARTPAAQQADALLLHGVLLARARDWLLQHPQRFISQDLEPLRAFISASAQAEDVERARSRRRRQRLLQGVAAAAAIFACVAAVAGWQSFEAERARRATELARQEAVAERDRAERNFAVAEEAADDVVFRLAEDLRTVQGMRVESIRRILEAAQALMDKLARAAPYDLQLQRSQAAMFSLFADTYLAAGDLARAQAAAEESLAIIRKLAASDPGNAGWQRDVSVSLDKVGDVRLAAGDRTGALSAYEESLAIRRKLTAADPGNAGWQSDVSVSLYRVGDVRVAAGDRAGALSAYEESLAIRRKLAAADPGNALWQREVSMSLNRVGDVRVAAGDRAGALSAYEESLAIMRKLAAADPGNAEWQRNVGVSLDRVGDVRLAAGDRAGALAAYEESLTIMRKLAAADPGNAGWQRDVSVSLVRVGDVRLAAGDRAGALSAYEESLAIRRKLAAADPGNAGWQRDLSGSLVRVGDVRLAASDRAGALSAYEESLAIMRKLAAADPGNVEWQRDVGASLDRVGNVRLVAGDRAGALSAYEESLTIMRKLAAADPGNAQWQREVSVSLYKVGDVRLAANDRAGALSAYEESLAIMRKLAAADPGNAGWQRDLSVSLEKVGDVRLAASDRAGALSAYEESLAIMRKLVAADPGNAQWQREVSVSLYKVGDVRLAGGDRAGALSAYEESLAIMRKLAAADPGNAGWQIDLVVSRYKVSRAADVPRAREALREALAILEVLAREGKLTAAQQNWIKLLQEELAKLPPETTQAQ